MSDAAGDRPWPPEVGSRGTETTLDLIVRVRGGDAHALDELIERYLPELRRWLSGRLPGWARQGVDTDDLVQDTLIQVFRKITTFEYRGDGALLAYLRQALMNRLRNQVRNAGRRPPSEDVDERLEASNVSPLEAALGSQALEAYEAALNSLDPPDREAIIARIDRVKNALCAQQCAHTRVPQTSSDDTKHSYACRCAVRWPKAAVC